jgi:hypothetical protein
MLVIEYPMIGETYQHDEYGVYEYGVYPDSSVLAGQERRSFVDSFPTLAEAKASYPNAEYNGEGSGYREVYIPESPPYWFDPANAGEQWTDD